MYSCSLRPLTLELQNEIGLADLRVAVESARPLPLSSGVDSVDRLLALGQICAQFGRHHDALHVLYSIFKPLLPLWTRAESIDNNGDHSSYALCSRALQSSLVAAEQVLARLPKTSARSCLDATVTVATKNYYSAKGNIDLTVYSVGGKNILSQSEVLHWNEIILSPCPESNYSCRSNMGLRGVLLTFLTQFSLLGDSEVDINVVLYNTAVLNLLDIVLDAYCFIPEDHATLSTLAEVHSFRASKYIDSAERSLAASAADDLLASELLRVAGQGITSGFNDDVTLYTMRMQRAELLLNLGWRHSAVSLLSRVHAMPTVQDNPIVRASILLEIGLIMSRTVK